MNRTFFRVCIVAVGLLLAGALVFSGVRDLVAEQAGGSNDYPLVGPEAGVYNNGQASFWDLNIIDHFRLFGHTGRPKGYAPQQPVAFSHVTHVQNNKIECQFCHWSVSKAAYAAIPEIQTCMGCHQLIPGKDAAAQAEVKKVQEAWTKGEPIEWVKVHVMPDYVKFNHKRHVKGGVSCQECHGQIAEMAVVQRVSSMKMGWCVDCHRARGTSIDCYVCHY